MNMAGKTILGVFAHPDDETFGPGGTLAIWASQGAKIYTLCATKGESGLNSLNSGEISKIREQEVIKASKHLGVLSTEFLGFYDGNIGNNEMLRLEEIITQKIKEYKPDALLTFDLTGISGHMDHIAVASATTQSYLKTGIVKDLYYYTVPEEFTTIREYFVYRPKGKPLTEIDITVDITDVWDKKVEAMHMHQTQKHDAMRIIEHRGNLPKHEHLMLFKKK